MKKILLFVGMFFFALQVSTAQDLLQGDPKASVEKNAIEYTTQLKKELALTGEQETLVRNTIKEHFMHIENLKDMRKNNTEAFMNRFKVLKENNINRMRNILRKPQFDKYIELLNNNELQREKE